MFAYIFAIELHRISLSLKTGKQEAFFNGKNRNSFASRWISPHFLKNFLSMNHMIEWKMMNIDVLRINPYSLGLD